MLKLEITGTSCQRKQKLGPKTEYRTFSWIHVPFLVTKWLVINNSGKYQGPRYITRSVTPRTELTILLTVPISSLFSSGPEINAGLHENNLSHIIPTALVMAFKSTITTLPATSGTYASTSQGTYQYQGYSGYTATQQAAAYNVAPRNQNSLRDDYESMRIQPIFSSFYRWPLTILKY